MIQKLQLERLGAAGYEVDAAISRLLGDEELYIHLLESFLQERSWESLEQVVQTQDYAAAYEIAHTIKGSLLTLGLVSQQEKMSEVMDALRKERKEEAQGALLDFIRQIKQLEELLE